MEELTGQLPLLLIMLALIGCSAFFSASEAALFFLSTNDRREMKSGSRAEKVAVELLQNPERLLSAVLFGNLVVNVSYFSLASVISIRMEQAPELGSTWAVGFAIGSLLTLIIFSEMLAKSIAVITPRGLARRVAIPIKMLVSLIGPLMPLLRRVNLISMRVLWPGFKTEPLIEIDDLEQAIELSRGNEALIRQEHAVLQNMVQLSEIRVEEWMRPRAQLQVLSPPVAFTDILEVESSVGYLLISELESDEIEKAIRLESHYRLPNRNLEKIASPVLFLPWTASVASALEKMSQRDRDVTVVVNEYGETMGILTVEDILETLFTYSPSRTERLLDRQPIIEVEPGKWLVQGMTNLRILARRLDLELPATRNVTVAGLIQDQMQRLAEVGDECDWGPCHFRVVETLKRGSLVAQLTLRPPSPEET